MKFPILFDFFLLLLIICSSHGDAYNISPLVSGVLTSLLLSSTPPTNTDIPSLNNVIAGRYDSYSSAYDQLDGKTSASANTFGVLDLRQQASESVSGDVLEVAIGTGLQSEYYDAENINSFTGIDLSEGMLKIAQQRLANTLSSVNPRTLKLMNAEKLGFKDETFDTVIDTFSMCVIPNPDEAIKEIARVAKSGGKVILLENTRSDNIAVAMAQDVLEPFVTPMSKDCRWNVDVQSLAIKHGLKLVNDERRSFGTLQLGVYKKS